MRYQRFLKIDELTRDLHHQLTPDDECFYLGEYTARKDYSYSETNSLIKNIKIDVEHRGNSNRWRHKTRAIREIGENIAAILGTEIEQITFFPAPPSKTKDDSNYDPRLVNILNIACANLNSDIRDIFDRDHSFEPAHLSGDQRPSIQELKDSYVFDANDLNNCRSRIAIFDDVLTTGTTFKAMMSTIEPFVPGSDIIGIFIARRVPSPDEFF